MASAGLDSLITVKVSFEGTTRRLKMPLRDMVPSAFERNIRTFLHIPAEIPTVFERYSDSAATFVQLIPDNVPVYKQLYRAAKAKSKLKIRVSIRSPARAAPKPVTVEDEAEGSASSPAPETESPSSDEKPEAAPENTQQNVPAFESAPEVAKAPAPAINITPAAASASALADAYRKGTLHDFAKRQQEYAKKFLDEIKPASPSVHLPIRTHERTATASSSNWMDELDPLDARSDPAVHRSVCPHTGATFAVSCNNCQALIPGPHYHCATCDDGDFDLCQPCVEQGVGCYSDDHWLIKRNIVDGQIMQSHTSTIAPKPKKKELDTNVQIEITEPKVEQEIAKAPEGPVEPEGSIIQRHYARTLTSKADINLQALVDRAMAARKAEAAEAKAAAEAAAEAEAKKAAAEAETKKVMAAGLDLQLDSILDKWATPPQGVMRTCNCCVQELPEHEFLHCKDCDDYDLCQRCFGQDRHGHHPKHAFEPAVKDKVLPEHIKTKMNAGRNHAHQAICDGCDKYIMGVRHKCLECPDFDFCSKCLDNSSFIHPMHRFVPVYEHLPMPMQRGLQAVHIGICCDGALCAEGYPSYIRGVRYKCAVCPDFDLCANCEASPNNTHNKTHPLIKFKTPVRHVSVTTTGERPNGEKMRPMGDRAPEPTPRISVNSVQTVVDMKPVDPAPVEKTESPEPVVKQEETEVTAVLAYSPFQERDLQAIFIKDTVRDGTILPPDHVFEQTWTLKNEGNVAWPAGCAVKFVGGDYMGFVDSNHPAEVNELVSASESTVCNMPLVPGESYPFTVLLRTPSRPGKLISYWRLTTPDGCKFGHRLWCDVNVRNVKESQVRASPRPVESPKEEIVDVAGLEAVNAEAEDVTESLASSQMVFPKLEKESPVASVHQSEPEVQSEPATTEEEHPEAAKTDDFDDYVDSEWNPSDDGFMTDEEYDILDASDEEYLEDQKKKIAAK